MAHENFAHKRGIAFDIIIRLLKYIACESGLDFSENFGNRIDTKCTLAEYIFMARLRMKFHHAHTGCFLATVVLLLH